MQLTDIVLLSLQVALVAMLTTAPFAIFFGWMLARKSFRGKAVVETLINLPLVLPPVVTGYLLLVLLGRNGVLGKMLYDVFGITLPFTWFAAVLAAAIVALPLFVRAVRVAMSSVDAGLEDAARVLRLPEWQIFRQITLPLSAHGVIAGSVLAFARALGEFGATIIVAGNIPGVTQTIPLAIFSLINQPGRETEVLLLLVASLLFALASLIISEWLVRRWRTEEAG